MGLLQSTRNLAAIFTEADFMKGGGLEQQPLLLCRHKEAVEANFDNFVVEVAMKYWLKRRMISLLKRRSKESLGKEVEYSVV